MKKTIVASLVIIAAAALPVSSAQEKDKPSKECYAKCKAEKDDCLKSSAYAMNKKRKIICGNVHRQCMDKCGK